MANDLKVIKEETVDAIAAKVKGFQDSGDLHFPADFSPENAMKSAWLMLQEIKDTNKRPVLESCTKESIANSLFDMVVQGLNPAKKQGYFIAYGSSLTFQRSYFGTMAVTKRLTGATKIDAVTIHEGDEVDYEIINGRYVNLKHKQKFGNTNKKIIGAYCTIEEGDGSLFTEIMTIEEIEKSWGQSKMNAASPGSTHSKFPVEMAKKTITNRACKRFLNSSNDSSLLSNFIQENDERVEEAQTRVIIEENANSEMLDFDETEEKSDEVVMNGVPVSTSTGEIKKTEETKAAAEDEGAGF